MKYQEIINQGSKILKINGIKSYNLDSEILLSSILKLDRYQLILNINKKIKDKEKYFFLNLVKRRIKNEPIAYITGYKEFWKSKFKVDKNVLIPRTATEPIIEQVLKNIPDYEEWHNKKVLYELGDKKWKDSLINLHDFKKEQNIRNSYYKRLVYDEILANILVLSQVRKRIKKL